MEITNDDRDRRFQIALKKYSKANFEKMTRFIYEAL